MKNRWTALAIAAAVAVGFAMGTWIPGDPRQAEAVIGGIGNLVVGGTPTDNHPHNFAYGSAGAASSNPNETRICVFCHTPHAADTTPALLNAPLWNHTLSSSSVTYSVKTPGVYTNVSPSMTINLNASPLSVPDGDSRLCLSCHDGTVSVGNVRSEAAAGGIPMQPLTDVITSGGMIDPNHPTAYIGTNLAQKHVVSVPMNAGLITDHNLNCNSNGQTTELKYPWQTGYGDTVFLRPTTAEYSGSGIDGASIQLEPGCGPGCDKNYGDGYNYGVQCSTCHDPHFWADTTNSGVEGYRMLVTGVNNLCGACHTATCPSP